MRTLFSDLNITGAAIVAAAAAVTLTLTVGLRLICTFRHDTGCTCMLVLTRLCHPRAFPPPKRSRRPTNKPGNQTKPTHWNTHRETRRENTPTSTPRQKDRGTGRQAATVTKLTKTNDTRPPTNKTRPIAPSGHPPLQAALVVPPSPLHVSGMAVSGIRQTWVTPCRSPHHSWLQQHCLLCLRPASWHCNSCASLMAV
jgi:hypothetical protein